MSKYFALIFTALFIIFPDKIKIGAKNGIENGIFVLLPSIFPYIAISGIFTKTGAADFVSDVIYGLVRPIFRFKKEFCSSYLISLFCGYPTGARLACESQSKDKREALRLFSFGNVPGFGFCVSFLGSLLGDTKMGVKIYLCFVFSSLILNYIFSFFLKENKEKTAKNEKKKKYQSFSSAVTESVKESALAIISIIGFAVFFSSVSELTKNIYVAAFLEITSGVPKLKSPCEIIFFTGFSGLSVIFQSLSFKKDDFNLLFVLFSRFLFAFTAVFLYYITEIIA